MRWYADNSDLNGIRGAKIPDMFLFGGIAVPHDSEHHLRKTIEDVKEKYGHPRAPIKWNFKNLKELYQKRNMDALYEKMLTSSKEWRKEIFENTSSMDFTVIISCIQSNSIKSEIIKNSKPKLSGYVFSNGLARVAMHATETKPSHVQIVLDWPDKNDSMPFDTEYASAYNDGFSRDRGLKYMSGPLKNIGFLDSPAYATMHHSTLLQFADLVVGATRGLLKCATEEIAPDFSTDMSKIISGKYRGYPNQIHGRGIVVGSRDSKFVGQIKTYIDEHLTPK